MKTKILTALVVAVVALTSVPMEASAQGNRNPVPTFAQRQTFNRLNSLLRGFRPGNPRVIATARRMMNLIPDASPRVLNTATNRTRTITNAQILTTVVIQVISSFRYTETQTVNLIVSSVVTVSNVAQTIPSIVNSTPQGTQEQTSALIRGEAVTTILADPNLNTIVENNAIPQISPTPTPVPYGA